MAQNVTVAGASYSDVPAVTLPKTGGGTASFTDVTGTTALAADVASGKYFFTASGVLTLGTASGGGAITWETKWDGNATIVSSSPNYVYISDYTDALEADQTYRITWGSDTYTCETMSTSSSSVYDGYFLGNSAVIGGTQSENNEPFLAYRTSSSALVFATTASAGTIYLKIELQGETSGGSANLQDKTHVTPTTSSQTITADSGYDGLSSVQIDAIPSQYIVPSGSETKTANGTYDVTNLAELVVNVASPVQTSTGTFTGNGTRTITFSCNFEPDIVYWNSEPGTSASSGTVAGIIVRDMMAANRYRNNSTTNSHYAIPDATGMNTAGSSYSHRATYDATDKQVTLYCWSNNARSLFTSGRSYSFKCVKWTS